MEAYCRRGLVWRDTVEVVCRVEACCRSVLVGKISYQQVEVGPATQVVGCVVGVHPDATPQSRGLEKHHILEDC